MNIGHVFLGSGLVAAGIGTYNMIQILNYLSRKGEKINWFFIRLKWFSYMMKYRELTVEESGEVGPYHRGYIISMLSALVLVIAGAVLINQ